MQQGMNAEARHARRYHWHSGDVTDFVDAPHGTIDGLPKVRSSTSPTDAPIGYGSHNSPF